MAELIGLVVRCSCGRSQIIDIIKTGQTCPCGKRLVVKEGYQIDELDP